MLFNSLEFGIFLPIVFLLYWFVFQNNLKWQNAFLLVVSYFFYGWWDWRFLFLIIFSSTLDFFIGQKIYDTKEENKKYYLWISLAFNLGLLGLFKYFNFFIDSFIDAFSFFGMELNSWSLNIILPVGISFYTFQTLSYTIDIYRGNLKPSKDIISFYAFVSFFPQLVAGPIERAANLLPQFNIKRKFDYDMSAHGVRQITWGFFKKAVIADSCGIFVEQTFSNYVEFSSLTLFIGAFLFCIQVYADFSGYSDIAIGTAKLFGFTLMTNFKTPYFSKSWGEFWKRWHISLSSWILDYVYNPIALNKRHWGKYGIVFGLMVTFSLNGLWHGANQTFVVFGFILGLYISVEFLLKKQRNKLKKRIGKNIHKILGWVLTMLSWLFACVFFRAESITHALDFIKFMFINPELLDFAIIFRLGLIPLWISILFIFDFLFKEKSYQFDLSCINNNLSRWSFYFIFITIISLFGIFGKEEFIYFQF